MTGQVVAYILQKHNILSIEHCSERLLEERITTIRDKADEQGQVKFESEVI